jgi:hypothetical protein
MPGMESINVKGHDGVASVNGAAIDGAITVLSAHGLEVRCFVADLAHAAAMQQAVAAVDPRGRSGAASRQHRRGAGLAFPRDERHGPGPDRVQPAPAGRLLPPGTAVDQSDTVAGSSY